MPIDFFYTLRSSKLPVSVKEYLTLLEALKEGVAGQEWLQRLTSAFPKFAWINSEPQGVWQYRQSISVVQQIMNQRMFPLTLKGLEEAMRLLTK